jgi:protein phosphatase
MLANGLLGLVLNVGPGIFEPMPPIDVAPVASGMAVMPDRSSHLPRHKKPTHSFNGDPLAAMAMAGALKGPRRFKLQSASVTDIGNAKRILAGKINEDAFHADDSTGLYVVADGVGGSTSGEVASAIAVKDMPPLVAQGVAQRSAAEIPDILKDALQLAHFSIFNEALLHLQHQGMATTAVMLFIHGAQAYVAHVGDSRVYHLRAGGLTQVTKDHSLVQFEIDKGLLTPAQARIDRRRHVITSSLGRGFTLPLVDARALGPIQGDDRFLLCSDGLNEMVEDGRIQEILANEKDPKVAAQKLIDEANQNGGHDNITVIVVDVTP